MTRFTYLAICLVLLVMILFLTSEALAQPTYSVDFQGPTALAPALGGPGAVSDGDILMPSTGGGPPPAPAVVYPAGFVAGGLGLAPTPAPPGIPPFSHGGVEVDALSYGLETPLEPDPFFFSHVWEYSVDELAVGIPTPLFLGPSLFLEGASGPLSAGVAPGAGEASADVFLIRTPPAFSYASGTLINTNTQLADGDGSSAPGLNLVDPNPPVPGLPDPGDNLDAWDGDTPAGVLPIYFSLDADAALGGVYPADPHEGLPVSTGSAAVNGFFGGDVLVSSATGVAPGLYAPAIALGLDDIGGPGSDNLDALALFDDGDGIYTPPTGPYDWLATPGVDMLLYSVQRGSAIIGVPDAISGVPITEGDVLFGIIDPLDGIPMQDGIDGDIDVAIFTFAEDLGLSTVRSGAGTAVYGPTGVVNPMYGVDDWDDELDALDVQQILNIPDHQPDGFVDASDFLAWQRGSGKVGPGLTEFDGDFTGDQVVDGIDLALWTSYYPFPLVPVVEVVPEPVSFMLFASSLTLIGLRRIRLPSSN